MISLRRARPDESDLLAGLLRASRVASIPAIPPPIHSEVEDRRWFARVMAGSEVWVADESGSALAVMVLNEDWLDQLYVAPGRTGQGIGTRLLEEAKRRRPLGLQLWAFQSNLGARRFYERHGFVAVEETDGSENEERAPDVRYRWQPPRRQIDPEAAGYLEWLAGLGRPPLAEQSPEQARLHNLEHAAELAGPVEAVRRVEDGHLPGPAGLIPYRLYSDQAAAAPALLYFHGGGWVVGDLDTHDSVCRALARRAGCAVVSVAYRLAPESQFPAALEDGWAALGWLAAEGQRLGIDTARLAIGGDSAGGNIAAVLARWTRDRGGPPLACQLLIYPVTDCDLDSPSYLELAAGYGLTRDSMRWYWGAYAPDPAAAASPDASPLRVEDLRELPPALVLTCELDPLAYEGGAYARRLAEAGVPVERIEEPGMIHGYIRLAGRIGRARKSWDDCARFLERNIGTG